MTTKCLRDMLCLKSLEEVQDINWLQVPFMRPGLEMSLFPTSLVNVYRAGAESESWHSQLLA